MIKRSDIENRVYDNNICTRFYTKIYVDGIEKLEAKFSRMDAKMWKMSIIFDRDRDADSQIYNFIYVIPTESMSLEKIAAFGLKFFQLKLKEEIQNKSMVDFAIGETLEGM